MIYCIIGWLVYLALGVGALTCAIRKGENVSVNALDVAVVIMLWPLWVIHRKLSSKE